MTYRLYNFYDNKTVAIFDTLVDLVKYLNCNHVDKFDTSVLIQKYDSRKKQYVTIA